MKKTLYILAALAAAVSCAKEASPESIVPEEEGLLEMTFSAAPTKTTFNGTDFVWTPGDEISVFDCAQRNRRFTTQSDAVSGTFTGRAKDSDVYYALYPYYESNAMTTAGVAAATIPTSQEAMPGTILDSLNISMGRISDGSSSFLMKNVGGYIKVVLPESEYKIASIGITAPGADALSGKVNVDYTGAEPVATPAAPSPAISLIPRGSDTFAAGTYYAVAVPGTITGGLDLSLTRDDDFSTIVSFPVTKIARNSALESTLTPDLSTCVWEEPAYNGLSVSFLNGTAVNQPFTEALPSSGTLVKDFVEYVCHLPETGEEFIFGSKNLNINSTTGLRMEEGGYVVFPAIPGKRLTKVTMEYGLSSATVTNYASICTDLTGSTTVKGGEKLIFTTSSQGQTYEWNLKGTTTGTTYALCVNEGSSNFRIRNFSLQYTGRDVALVKRVGVSSAERTEEGILVKGEVTADNPEKGLISWGAEYREEGQEEWTGFGTGTGLEIEALIAGADPDKTYYVRLYARADAMDPVYSAEKKIRKNPVPFEATFDYVLSATKTVNGTFVYKTPSSSESGYHKVVTSETDATEKFPYHYPSKKSGYSFYYVQWDGSAWGEITKWDIGSSAATKTLGGTHTVKSTTAGFEDQDCSLEFSSTTAYYCGWSSKLCISSTSYKIRVICPEDAVITGVKISRTANSSDKAQYSLLASDGTTAFGQIIYSSAATDPAEGTYMLTEAQKEDGKDLYIQGGTRLTTITVYYEK